MSRFGAQHDDITVDHMISESSRDYRRAGVKLRIRYGFGSWPNESADLLFGDVIYPVCGPAFAQKHHDVTAKCLPELPLVSNGSNRAGPAGGSPMLRPESPGATLQAAQAGQGVAVGWHRLVRTWSKKASS